MVDMYLCGGGSCVAAVVAVVAVVQAWAWADRLVISAELWNEVIPLNGQLLQASLRAALRPPLL